ncbi:hypothetical protein DSO57_1002931 [Entomophthora muscae]|uniref:Uncharacterized protein n=1 Tax=Entomophthora muscae TaxID=34485 RepID=A0ACC2T8S4_9FUNG|nr:hypothetical protein DSO57_1002931 [Entomophthora muscae]
MPRQDDPASATGEPQVQTLSKVVSVRDAMHYAILARLTYRSEEFLERELIKPDNKYNVDQYAFHYSSGKSNRAIIFLDHKRNDIILGFRGTDNPKNLLTNININQVDFIAGKVHEGFKNMTYDLKGKYKELLMSYLKDYPSYTLVVTGHSLGGALAVLSTAILQQELGIKWDNIYLITYGQPRVGDRAFASWLNSKPLYATRVVNDYDGIPHLPPKTKTGYVHTHTEIYLRKNIAHICQSTVFEAKTCSNSRAHKFSKEGHDMYRYKVDLMNIIYGGAAISNETKSDYLIFNCYNAQPDGEIIQLCYYD